MQRCSTDYSLIFMPDYVGLHNSKDESFKPFYLDFLSPPLQYRAKRATLRNELLARAIGLKPKDHPFIVDATAGLGRDSFILATLGFQITLLEQSPLIYALLADAIQRGAQSDQSALFQRMRLFQTESIDWLKSLQGPRPDIIYLDPMFPERKKSASVKKEMVIFQELLGKYNNVTELTEDALTYATRRVIVKRPRLSLPALPPDFSLTGTTSRFDIYLTAKALG